MPLKGAGSESQEFNLLPACKVSNPNYYFVFLFSIQALQRELNDSRPQVEEVMTSSEGFMREHKDRLGHDQQDVLQRGVYDLRSHTDKANHKVQDWVRQMKDKV